MPARPTSILLHTKWGVRGLSRIARLDEADVLVSDSGLPREARMLLGEHIERLVLAPRRPGAPARLAEATDEGHL